jgi:hypothetical protein
MVREHKKGIDRDGKNNMHYGCKLENQEVNKI